MARYLSRAVLSCIAGKYIEMLIGESGGFLLDIRIGDKFVNTNLLTEMANKIGRASCRERV